MKVYQITISLIMLAIVSFVTGVPTASAQYLPPDTTTFWASNESGVMMPMRRPPDSVIVPGQIIIRFHQGALDYDKLLGTYEYWYYGRFEHKGKKNRPFTEPPLPNGGPRGFPTTLQNQLRDERFYLDSENNIIKDTALWQFLKLQHCTYLKRLTTASPFDTLSVTRCHDTIGCDHYNWMLLSFDSTVNSLNLAYELVMLYPAQVYFAQPDYSGWQLLRHPGDDFIGYDSCQFSIRHMINVEKAWDYEVGDSSILISHFDGGADYRHPDFGDTIGVGHHVKYGEQFAENRDHTFDPIFANQGHGTPCLGIIGALTNRTFHSVAGIAGGWGTLKTGASDTIERGQGCALVILASSSYVHSTYIAAMFEASAYSPSTSYGYGVNVTNISAKFSGNDYAVKAASNYAYENHVVQVAAMNQQQTGQDETGLVSSDATYPVGFDEPWMIGVGGEVPEVSPWYVQKVKSSNYGRTMDILAPAGNSGDGIDIIDTTNGSKDTLALQCLNAPGQAIVYSTANINETNPFQPNFKYRGFGGNSAAAPHVAGSAGLIVTHFWRLSQPVEPEDIGGILKAAAYRSDSDRVNKSIPNTWRVKSGWGYLDIGRAFEMMDSFPGVSTHSAYHLNHYSVTDTAKMVFGDWTTQDSVLMTFNAPWDHGTGVDTSLYVYHNRSYLINTSKDFYFMAKARPVTAIVTLDSIWEVNADAPLFAWGRGGQISEKSGWSFDNQPNYQNGWTRITDGTGGTDLNEGIFHSQSVTFSLETAQFAVWGRDTTTGQLTKYLGLFPPDSMLGMNFSVYGRISSPISYVRTPEPKGNSPIYVIVKPEDNIVNVRFYCESAIEGPKVEIFDILGRLLASRTDIHLNPGWNTMSCQANGLNSGTFFCRVSGPAFVQSTSFQVVK